MLFPTFLFISFNYNMDYIFIYILFYRFCGNFLMTFIKIPPLIF
ncbi:hypothetical protein CM318V1_220030 [Carnobacterium maltaromaticum]|nr:hypothetical protein CM318V1_220030 [Carnobacterium maltaromaticum]